MDAKISIDDRLSAVPETMLIPLWSSADETQRVDSIIKDISAIDILSRIAYDFSLFGKAWMSQVGVCIKNHAAGPGRTGVSVKQPERRGRESRLRAGHSRRAPVNGTLCSLV